MGHFALKSKVKTNGFEGWYVRFTDPDQSFNTSLIFAHTTDESDPHAFIQVFDGVKRTNTYHRFDSKEFRFQNDVVKIGKNRLSMYDVGLDVPELKLKASFEKPVFNREKSAMGLLEKLPLETFQEVVIMGAKFKGTFTVNGKSKDIQGQTYMEKTYGQKFPKTWFWVQANHFNKLLYLSMSGGHVPTLKFRPFGFFVLLYTKTQSYRFATYNFSKIDIKEIDGVYTFTVKKRALTLTVTVTDHTPTTLVGPTDGGKMILDVFESIDAHVHITLKNKDRLIVEAESPYGGFEYMMKG